MKTKLTDFIPIYGMIDVFIRANEESIESFDDYRNDKITENDYTNNNIKNTFYLCLLASYNPMIIYTTLKFLNQ